MLTALNRKNIGFNGVEPEKIRALTTLDRKNSGVNGAQPEKNGVNGV